MIGVIDGTCDWRIEGLKECVSLEFVGIVIPFDNVIDDSTYQNKLLALGQILGELPPTLPDLKLVVDFRSCDADMDTEKYFLAMKWHLIQPYLASLSGLRRLCVALNKPVRCKCSDWSNDMLEALRPALSFEQYVEIYYSATP